MLTGFVFFSTNNWLCCGNLYYAHYFRLCNMSGDILPGAALWETAGESNRNRARYFFFSLAERTSRQYAGTPGLLLGVGVV